MEQNKIVEKVEKFIKKEFKANAKIIIEPHIDRFIGSNEELKIGDKVEISFYVTNDAK